MSIIIGKSYFLFKFWDFLKEYLYFKINIINKFILDIINLVKEDKLDLGIIVLCKNEILNEVDF